MGDNVGYRLNWMQMSLEDDSDDEGILDPCKELTVYLVWQARVTRPCRKSHHMTSKLQCPNPVAESTGLIPSTALTPDNGHQ